MNFIIERTDEYQAYKIRHSETSMYWSDILIDCGNNSGRLIIVSDYGKWSHYWDGCGKPFKEFLIDLEKEEYYVGRKFKAFNTDGEISSQFKRFWKEVWPVFTNMLKKEIEHDTFL